MTLDLRGRVLLSDRFQSLRAASAAAAPVCAMLSRPAAGVIGFTSSSVTHGCFAGALFQCFLYVVIRAVVCLPEKKQNNENRPDGLSALPNRPLFSVDANFNGYQEVEFGEVCCFRI